MKARSLLVFSGLALTILSLSGCGGKSDAPATAAAPAPEATAPSGRSMPAPGDKAGETTGEQPASVSGGGGYGGGSTGGASYGSESGTEPESGPDSHGGPSMAAMGAPSGGGPSMMSMGAPNGGGGPASHGGPGPSMASMGTPMGGGGGPASHGGPGPAGSSLSKNEGGTNPGDMRGMAANAGKGGMMGAGGALDGEGFDAGYEGSMPSMEGMGMGGMGMGGTGMGGMGMPGGSMNMNTVVQFVNTNCISCHGAANAKGGVRLVGLTSVAAEPLLWQSVVEQLEAGSMPPRASGRSVDAQQSQAVTTFLKQQLQAAGLDDSQDYMSKANFYFSSGKEEEAVEYYYAHVLTADDEEARDLLSKARLFAAGKRPVATLRFAVGVILEAPEGIDVKPIGVSQFGGAGGGGGMGGEMAGYPGAGGSSDKQKTFYALTGDFGRELVSAFESQWASGAMGLVFNEVTGKSAPVAADQGGMNPGGMGSGLSPAGMSMGGMGRGGMSMGSEGEGGMGMGMGMSGNGASEPGLPGSQLKPGLVYLGTGTQQELLKQSQDAGVDGLFVYDVEATQNRRNGVVNNSTRLRLMLTDGSAVTSTKTLSNTEIEREKQRGTSDDEVKENIERLFAKVDESLKLTPMPTLSAESARRRVHQLVHDKSISKLQTLFETRLYQSLGSLTVDDVSTVYQIVLRGNEGISLATGAADDRKVVVDELMEQL